MGSFPNSIFFEMWRPMIQFLQRISLDIAITASSGRWRKLSRNLINKRWCRLRMHAHQTQYWLRLFCVAVLNPDLVDGLCLPEEAGDGYIPQNAWKQLNHQSPHLKKYTISWTLWSPLWCDPYGEQQPVSLMTNCDFIMLELVV